MYFGTTTKQGFSIAEGVKLRGVLTAVFMYIIWNLSCASAGYTVSDFSHCKLPEGAQSKTKNRSVCHILNFVLGVAERKPLQELKTEHVHVISWTAEWIPVV